MLDDLGCDLQGTSVCGCAISDWSLCFRWRHGYGNLGMMNQGVGHEVSLRSGWLEGKGFVKGFWSSTYWVEYVGLSTFGSRPQITRRRSCARLLLCACSAHCSLVGSGVAVHL